MVYWVTTCNYEGRHILVRERRWLPVGISVSFRQSDQLPQLHSTTYVIRLYLNRSDEVLFIKSLIFIRDFDCKYILNYFLISLNGFDFIPNFGAVTARFVQYFHLYILITIFTQNIGWIHESVECVTLHLLSLVYIIKAHVNLRQNCFYHMKAMKI